MPLLTVITPVHRAGADRLAETAASVHAAELPDGWSVQWVVQEDGGDALRRTVLDLGGEYDHHPARSGVSITRNLALARGRGELVLPLDADDELLPSGLAVMIDALGRGTLTAAGERVPLGWVAGGHVDGAGVPDRHWRPDEARVWHPGELLAVGAGGLGFHPNNLLVRAGLLWRVGGWPALPGLEDELLVLQLNGLAAGASLAVPSVHYRRHPGQTVASPDFLGHLERSRTWLRRYVEETVAAEAFSGPGSTRGSGTSARGRS